MRPFIFLLTVSFATFSIGVGIVAYWFLNQPLPRVDLLKNSPECASEPTTEISLSKTEIAERTELLARFKELPLDKLFANTNESYRLIWFPTFHAPTIIRIWRSGENYHIITKRLSGEGGYEIGKLKTEYTRSLTAEEWQNFVNLINVRCFWNAPSVVAEVPVVDGASWTFEGLTDKQYQFVDRITPSEQMTEIFKALFELTGVKTEYDDYL